MNAPADDFDLAHGAWIDCRYRDGTTRRTGLYEAVSDASSIADLTLPYPIAYGALYRIAAAIAYRVTGLDRLRPGETATDWYRRRNAHFATGFDQRAVDRYFRKHAAHLRLYHRHRPFLQDPRLAEECPRTSGIGKLVIGRPVGNARPWFSDTASQHHAAPVPSGEAALESLMWAYYGSGGALSTRSHQGVSAHAGCMAAVLRGTVGYHPIGPDLHTTLLAHLTPPGVDSHQDDLASWENPAHADPTRPPPSPTGPVSLLAARTRHAILLVPSADGRFATDWYVTWGARNSPHKPGRDAGGHVEPFPDPFLSYQRSRESGAPSSAVKADGGRQLFRDLDVLLNDPATEPQRARRAPTRPQVLASCDQIPDEVADTLRLRVVGAEQDREKSNDHQWWTTTTPPLLTHTAARDPEGAQHISEAVHEADLAEWHLDNALAASFEDRSADTRARKARIALRFWPVADAIFWNLYGTGRLDDATRRMRVAALDAFDQLTADLVRNPSAGERIAQARARLPLPPRKAAS
ncbi:type I-E CRISPR-associated protein Cse1/CasA [Kitasatospora sp. NPDC058170]|uniref:type I-E CRISPR-associated protein Cse1/CasA n=1 Tax=Kitasatospora sp. NPDC058170 TaxID=3346364 RepID=UPI0036D90436